VPKTVKLDPGPCRDDVRARPGPRRDVGSGPRRDETRKVPSKAAAPEPVPMQWSTKAPELSPIEYDGVLTAYAVRQPDPDSTKSVIPTEVAVAAKAGTQTVASAKAETHAHSDPARQRIFERYVGARFPGVASRSEDFRDMGRIIKAARLFFEDAQLDRAVELLQIACDVSPADQAPWLAKLELQFLGTDGAGFAGTARRFASTHPRSLQWPEICELANKLGLADAVFQKRRASENANPEYGPWPGLPNWIQAPWDLTSEVALAELHARLRSDVPAAQTQAARRAA